MMLHVKSPIPAGSDPAKVELDGGWAVPWTDVGLDPAITGDDNYWYAAFTQGGFLYVMRDGSVYGPNVRWQNPPSNPEIVLYQAEPLVAWTENSGNALCLAMQDGSHWTMVGTALAPTGYFHDVRIAVSGTDLYVAYVHQKTPPSVGVERWDGANWSVMPGQIEDGTGSISTLDIAVHGGQPVVCFVEGTECKVKKYRP